ncbi:MAG: ATP-grasp domain-containing protein [Pseudomonadota bacterium]
MNILITAVGAMASECAITCLRESFPARIFGVDTHDGSLLPTVGTLDGFQTVPPAKHPGYVPALLEICRHFDIDCVLPLTDPEVDVLVARSRELPGTLIRCLPAPAFVAVARNKRRLAVFAETLDCSLPIDTQSTDDGLPANTESRICKPMNGRSSEGLLRYAKGQFDRSQLQAGRDYIFQPLIPGDIVTVDAVRDREGGIAVLARKELVRTPRGAGLVVDVGESPAEEAAIEVCERLDLVGGVNIEFLQFGPSLYLMDINPRLSAGVEFSFLAGYDFPTNTVRACMGDRIAERGPVSGGRYAKRYVGTRLAKVLPPESELAEAPAHRSLQ